MDEVLIALSTSAATDLCAQQALEQLPKLAGCQVHSSVILSSVDMKLFNRLSVQVTTEPQYENKQLFSDKFHFLLYYPPDLLYTISVFF